MLPLIRAALVFFSLSLFAAAASAAVVTGTVTDAATHQPLSGMVVAAYDLAGTLRGTATTDATGLYALTLPAGSYRLLSYDNAGVYATTFDGDAESFESSNARQLTASTTLQLPFALVRGGLIVGSVQKASGLPSTSATIEAYNLSGTRRGFTTSTATGNYTLVLPPGDYKLVAFESSPSLAPQFYRDARSFAEATIVHVDAERTTSNIRFTLPVAARVSGTAIDADNHTLLSNIDVYAYTSTGALVLSTTTNANGAFSFTLPPGAYRFVAADAKRIYATAFYATSRSFENAEVVTLLSGDVRSGITLSLPRAALIEGHVDATRVLTVSAYNLDGTLHAQITTSSNYKLAVAPGSYKLVVSDPTLRYASEFYRESFDFFSAATLSVIASEHRTGIDFTPPVGGHVVGFVRDATQGSALAGITVAAYNADGLLVWSAVTGTNGKYELVLPPAQFRLIAFDPQLTFAPRYRGNATNYEESIPIDVVSGATIANDFAMLRGVKIGGQVVDTNANALSGIEVFALDLNGHRVAGATTVDGEFALAVPPGSYKLIAQDPRGRLVRRYYPDADSWDHATVLNLGLNQSVPALSFTLPVQSRQRAVHH